MARRGRGEGSVFERRDGRWAAEVSVGGGRRRTYYGRTQGEVLEKLAAAKRALALGAALPGATRTVAAFAQEYLAGVAKPELKPRSYLGYQTILLRHVIPAIGDVRLERLTTGHIQTYVLRKFREGLSAATVARHRAVVGRMLEIAVRWGYLSRNPAKHLSMPRGEPVEIQPLTPEQARQFLAATATDRLTALYRMAFTLGLRQGEILGLTWDHVDLDGGLVRVERQLQRYERAYHLDTLKTPKSRRTVGLPDALVEALRDHRIRQLEDRLRAGPAWDGNEWGLVFTTPAGSPLNGNSLTHRFQATLQRAGLPRVSFHACRHGAASFALAQGVDLRTIQELLGHSSYAITADLYIHLQAEATRDATEKIGALLA